MVGVLSDCVISTETVPKLPLESRARMVTLGLFTRRDWDHPAVDQYRHAKRCVGISGIDLFHFLFGFFLTRRSRTDSKKNKFTLNVIADDRVIEEKDRGAGEPLQFYTGSERLLCEVVSLSVEKNKVPAI